MSASKILDSDCRTIQKQHSKFYRNKYCIRSQHRTVLWPRPRNPKYQQAYTCIQDSVAQALYIQAIFNMILFNICFCKILFVVSVLFCNQNLKFLMLTFYDIFICLWFVVNRDTPVKARHRMMAPEKQQRQIFYAFFVFNTHVYKQYM